MPETPESLRSALGGIHAQAAKTADATAAIRAKAEERIADIDRKLAELRPSTLTDESSAREYSELIEERGTLAQALGL